MAPQIAVPQQQSSPTRSRTTTADDCGSPNVHSYCSSSHEVRALAQEATTRYLSMLDNRSPHGKNVEEFLRPVVTMLTHKILSTSTTTQNVIALDNNNNNNKNDVANDVDKNNTKSKSTPSTFEFSRRTHARLEAFLQGCLLAVPNDDRTKSSGSHMMPDVEFADGLKPPATSSPTLGGKSKHLYPQIRQGELSTRLELYIKSCTRVKAQGKECVLKLESKKCLRVRANGLVRSFVATASCVKNINPCLGRLLQVMTLEVLAVDTLCDEIMSLIRRVVSEYQHQISFASLAFLSSPEDSAANRLTPLVVSYLSFLQANHQCLIKQCQLEHMLRAALDTNMRHTFKTIEFQSIGHLLDVCNNYSTALAKINIAPQHANQDASSLVLKQALCDLQRETITVNGKPLPPVESRHELIRLLSQVLNSRSLFHGGRTKFRGGRKIKPRAVAIEGLDSEGFLSSESDVPRKNTNRRRRSRFHLSMIDCMTKRLLVASSRTGLGGDAYFVVRDLFGGDDVEVVPSNNCHPDNAATIEIQVRLSSVTIKCIGKFDVYPKTMVAGDCNAVTSAEPLIQLHTTTTEVIELQEVRASDSEDGKGRVDNDDSSSDEDEDGSSGSNTKLVLREKVTEQTGWRTVSIKPAKYERVNEWNTPS